MEQNLPMAKRVWNIVRVAFFMLRKGVSKRKLMVDLNVMLKRGKNLMFRSHRRHVASAESPMCPHEYEFSCSNTPAHGFPFFHAISKKNKHPHQHQHQHQHHREQGLFACAHAPPTTEDDMAAVRGALEILNNMGEPAADVLAAPSPFLPGFGRTPLVRPLRITDSPFPLKEEEGDVDKGQVDKAAEEFIQRFYKNLKQQKKMIECN